MGMDAGGGWAGLETRAGGHTHAEGGHVTRGHGDTVGYGGIEGVQSVFVSPITVFSLCCLLFSSLFLFLCS